MSCLVNNTILDNTSLGLFLLRILCWPDWSKRYAMFLLLILLESITNTLWYQSSFFCVSTILHVKGSFVCEPCQHSFGEQVTQFCYFAWFIYLFEPKVHKNKARNVVHHFIYKTNQHPCKQTDLNMLYRVLNNKDTEGKSWPDTIEYIKRIDRFDQSVIAR